MSPTDILALVHVCWIISGRLSVFVAPLIKPCIARRPPAPFALRLPFFCRGYLDGWVPSNASASKGRWSRQSFPWLDPLRYQGIITCFEPAQPALREFRVTRRYNASRDKSHIKGPRRRAARTKKAARPKVLVHRDTRYRVRKRPEIRVHLDAAIRIGISIRICV